MARDTENPMRGGDTPSLGRRDVLIGGALLAASGLAYARLPRTPARLIGNDKLDDLVPKVVGAWEFQTTSGLVLPPADQMSQRIYSQLLTRQYIRPNGTAVMLLIAYSGSQDGVIQVHRPEICYPASGYRLVQNAAHDVRLANNVDVAARYIVAEREVRREQIMYWTRLGSYFPATWADQRRAVIRENLAGIIPDGVLMRFSSIGDQDIRGVLDEFASELYEAVGPVMKRVMTGAGQAAGTTIRA